MASDITTNDSGLSCRVRITIERDEEINSEKRGSGTQTIVGLPADSSRSQYADGGMGIELKALSKYHESSALHIMSPSSEKILTTSAPPTHHSASLPKLNTPEDHSQFKSKLTLIMISTKLYDQNGAWGLN